MPLPFEGDPALLGRLLAGISEVGQERRRRQDRKQEHACSTLERGRVRRGAVAAGGASCSGC